MRTRLALSLSVAVGGLASGCSSSSSKPAPVASARSVPEAGDSHSHDREKMRLTDAGPYHAALTAHLGKDGNELDIFLETTDKDPKPAAIAQTAIVARATRAGDPTEYMLAFDPAPPEERPKDEPAGQCSHFVARATWMKPDDVLTVKCDIELMGKRRAVVWKEFVPRKYAHVDETPHDPPAP